MHIIWLNSINYIKKLLTVLTYVYEKAIGQFSPYRDVV